MSFLRFVVLLSILSAIAYITACVPPETPQSNQSQSNTALPPAANAASTPNAEENELISRAPFTMPMLDAMFIDESFESEARRAFQLTDEEIDKLQTAARNEVLKLSNDPAQDDERSTRIATENATKQINEILGKERGERFISFVKSRWLGAGEPLSGKPNSVPTDTRVVVNIPAYRMDVFDNGQLLKSYKIGIGYPEFPLPTGLRKANTIIFNPTWTPPDEPWVKGKVRPGKTVEAGSKLNPLGPIKIPIGLPSLIHGGKSPSRLGTFASHGCIGLTSPQVQDFAMEISKIAGKPLSLEEIRAYEKKKTETEEVKLGQEIPVELRYETIVVENGTLKIYRDVYEHGTNTEDNLKRVLSEFGVSLESLDHATQKKILEGIEDMAVDARGEPVDVEANSNSAKKPASKSGRVTRNIKGRKEVSFPIPQLSGKGYPAPVELKAN
jgi:lipoprotein-anchoring transpeptidase ErfK/SrfK